MIHVKNQVRLPSLRHQSIKKMPMCSSAYTVSWALCKDEDGYLWLDTEMPLNSRMGGTYDLEIIRLDVGFWVHPRDSEFDPHDIPPVSKASGQERYAPVMFLVQPFSCWGD